MNNSKISIIIPVYNGSKTLKQCLESVLDQTYDDYEVIGVDNNSTDSTQDIILDFQKKDKRIKYVFEAYQSRGAARNAGIQAASGKIIAMTDSDCIVPPDWLEKITQPIRHNNEFIVQGNESDALNNYWTRMQQEFSQNFLQRHLRGKYIDHIDTKNFAISKKVLEKVGYFNKNNKDVEDFELKLRLKKKGYQIYFLPNLKVKHHHKNTFRKITTRRFGQGYWTLKTYQLHKEYLKDNPDEMVKSIKPFYFLMFFPWSIFFLFKNGFKKFEFEFITGTAWRLGILAGLLKLKI